MAVSSTSRETIATLGGAPPGLPAGARMLPGGIALELLGTDDAMHRAAAAYWERDGRGRWVHAAAEIAAEIGVEHATVLAAVLRPHALAHDAASTCPSCGRVPTVTSRSEALSPKQRATAVCETCTEANEGELELARRSAVAEWCRGFDQPAPSSIEQIAAGEPLLAWAMFAVCASHRGTDEVLRAEDWTRDGEGEQGLYGERHLDERLLRRLVAAGFIRPDPSTPTTALTWDAPTLPGPWHPVQLHYTLPQSQMTVQETATALRDALRSRIWHEAELLDLWHGIVAADATANLSKLMAHRYRQASLPAHHAFELYDKLLPAGDSLTPGQLTSMGWSAAKNGFAWDKRTPGSSPERAAKAAATSMASWIEEPGRFPHESYKRAVLLNPWSKIATRFFNFTLGHVSAAQDCLVDPQRLTGEHLHLQDQAGDAADTPS
jgi:hypothetical protein